MSLTIAIQMDRPEDLNPATDSTYILALEAQKRGHTLFYYHPDGLSYCQGHIKAHAHPITFKETDIWYELGKPITLNLATTDVVLMRQDPPFDMHYLSATYLLEQLPQSTYVCNNPTSVRNLPEKLYPFYFEQYMPPTLITKQEDDLWAFLGEQKEIVIKPLYGHGGRGIFHIREDSDNLRAIIESLLNETSEPIIAQRFLPEVATEDKRVLLIDGKVEGVVGRLPAEGEIRANFRVGGTAAKSKLTEKQQEICEIVGQSLLKKEILFAGLDLIGDWLTEINITSPTGLRPVKDLYSTHPEKAFWAAIEKRFR